MSDKRVHTSQDNPFVIANPSLGFVNFLGETGLQLMQKDRATLGGLFQDVRIADRAMPKCNVLFLYLALDKSGRLPGARFTFRDVIGAAGAHVAVLASELSPALLSDREFTASLSQKHAWPANIVITLNRNGEHFATFFHRLFSFMLSGMSMPMAWAELAPQGPIQPKDIPGTICLLEAGHIAFARKQGAAPDIRVTGADRF